MHSFSFQSQFKTTKAKLFDWHKKTFALERLTPPWESIKVKERIYEGNNFIDGGRIRLQHELIPLIKLNWNLIHKNYSEGNHFTDYMIKGPFKYLNSVWIFEKLNNSCKVTFELNYEFKSFFLARIMGAVFNKASEKMFVAFEKRAHELYE